MLNMFHVILVVTVKYPERGGKTPKAYPNSRCQSRHKARDLFDDSDMEEDLVREA